MARQILIARPERRVADSPLPVRNLTVDDAEPLSELLCAGYSDSPDSDGETIEGCREEVASYLTGTYGDPVLTSSFVAFQENGDLASGCLVVLDRGQPQIAYLCTRPEWRRQGIGRAVLTHTLNTLRLEDFDQCVAQVGVDNVPAQRLLRLLNFSDAGSDGEESLL